MAGPTYARAWLLTEPILIGLRVCVAIEAFSLISAKRMGWWRFTIPLTAGAVAAALLSLPSAVHPSLAAAIAPISSAVFAMTRASWGILALGMLLMLVVYAVPIGRPKLFHHHYWLATAFFATQALPYAGVYALGSGWIGTLSAVALGGAAVVHLAWAWVIRGPGPDTIIPSDPGPLDELLAIVKGVRRS